MNEKKDDLEMTADELFVASMANKLASNVDDSHHVTQDHHNLTATLALFDVIRHTTTSIEILEHCAKHYSFLTSDEQVHEWLPWLMASLAVLTNLAPDCLIDTHRFIAAVTRVEPIVKRGVELTFH